MSYQVLARKWRPRDFSQVIGQQHVVRALSNALTAGHVHQAYLLTGTRGVGKTTLARIIAKCLNCETGITATPCGECGSCQEVDAGRFMDLLEVDAASRSKVDETRELMDNVGLAPARGRYKVYLIDEVHMFSDKSFNALLKTLEEPPPHVCFLLATTDPQKLPITVLSRCVRLGLKPLPAAQIAGHLATVAEAEGVEAEAPALARLGQAADGSMRDALTLMEQGLAFGDGALKLDEVGDMLGVIDHEHLLLVLEALVAKDAQALVSHVAAMTEAGVDFGELLRELVVELSALAVRQLAPDAATPGVGHDPAHESRRAAIAEGLTPEDVQLYYQFAVMARRDLPYASDERTAFEMAVLRMHAFGMTGGAASPATPSGGSGGAPAPRQPTGGSPGVRRPPAVSRAGAADETVERPGTAPADSRDGQQAEPHAAGRVRRKAAAPAEPLGAGQHGRRTAQPADDGAGRDPVATGHRRTARSGPAAPAPGLRAHSDQSAANAPPAQRDGRGELPRGIDTDVPEPPPWLTEEPPGWLEAMDDAYHVAEEPATSARGFARASGSREAVAAPRHNGSNGADEATNSAHNEARAPGVARHEQEKPAPSPARRTEKRQLAAARADAPPIAAGATPYFAPEDWPDFVDGLGLAGGVRELAANSELVASARAADGGRLVLRIAPEHAALGGAHFRDRLAARLSEALARDEALAEGEAQPGQVRVDITVEDTGANTTLNQRNAAALAARHRAAVVAAEADPVVQAICATFDTRLEPALVRPVELSGPPAGARNTDATPK